MGKTPVSANKWVLWEILMQQHLIIHIYILLFNGDIYQGFIHKKFV